MWIYCDPAFKGVKSCQEGKGVKTEELKKSMEEGGNKGKTYRQEWSWVEISCETGTEKLERKTYVV